MTDNELLTIGRFARLSGLSVYTLRHHDDIGFLSSATIDATSGYRRSQVQTARLIQALRSIDLPLDQVRIILQDPVGDPARAHSRRTPRPPFASGQPPRGAHRGR